MTTTSSPLAALAASPRLVLEAELTPVVGSTFQPTGFPNLGAATFERPGHPPMLLVESAQSLTNHLEQAGWDTPTCAPITLLGALPYVAVHHAGDDGFLTSSRLEPHRLASAYVKDASIDGEKGIDWLVAQLGLERGRPLDYRSIYAAIFALDPLCLIHGVYFSDKRFHGNPKVRRALTLVLEGEDVREVVSGGVKRDDVAFKVERDAGQGAEEGYGFVPFGRNEYSAGRLVLSAALDLAQLRGYGLSEPATELLTAIALWELRALLDAPLRLRTRCDLDVVDITVRRPRDMELPGREELEAVITSSTVTFEHPGERRLSWQPKGKTA